jgi:chloramphenicol O-acetyltransferase type A
MHTIDLNTWPRRKHYELFRTFDYPHFNLCAPLDITRFQPAVKAAGVSFTTAVIYVLSRAANEQVEFRWRMRGDQVVEHDLVHPAPTVLGADDLFSYCEMHYHADFLTFCHSARQAMQHAQAYPSLEDEPGRDDYLFMTGIPWVSFTSMMHPIHMHPADSVPRLAWGKFYQEGQRIKMPVSVQVNHALMDGVHVGKYYERVQSLFETLLS